MAIPWRALLLALLAHSLWGGNVVGVKLGMIAVPPLWSAFWRFFLGALVILAWARINRIPIMPQKGEARGLALLGLLFIVQIGVMNLGFARTSGAMGSILIATNPLFAALFAHFFAPGDALRPIRSLGLAIAFAGIVLLFLPGADQGRLAEGMFGNLLVILSATMLGGRLVFSSRLLQRIDPIRVNLWQMLLSLPAYALGGLLWEQVAWEKLTWIPLAGLAYQGLIVAGLGFMLLSFLLRSYNPSVVTGFNFLAPVIGVLLSGALLGDPLTWRLWAGLASVGLGLVLIARK